MAKFGVRGRMRLMVFDVDTILACSSGYKMEMYIHQHDDRICCDALE